MVARFQIFPPYGVARCLQTASGGGGPQRVRLGGACPTLKRREPRAPSIRGAHAPLRVVFRALAENSCGTRAYGVSTTGVRSWKLAARAITEPSRPRAACCAGGAPQEISRGQVRAARTQPPVHAPERPAPAGRRRNRGPDVLRCPSGAANHFMPPYRGRRSAGRTLPPANLRWCPSGTGAGPTSRRGAHAAGVPFSAARRKPRPTHLHRPAEKSDRGTLVWAGRPNRHAGRVRSPARRGAHAPAAERGVHAAESRDCNRRFRTARRGARCCGLKAALRIPRGAGAGVIKNSVALAPHGFSAGARKTTREGACAPRWAAGYGRTGGIA